MYFVGKVSSNAIRWRNSHCPRVLVDGVLNAIPVYSFNSELIPYFDQTFSVRRRRLALTAELCSAYWDELIVAVTRSKFSHKKLDPFLEARLNYFQFSTRNYFVVSDPCNMYFVGKVSSNAVRWRNSQCPRALVDRVPNAIPGNSFNSKLIPNFDQTFFVRRRRLALTAELCSAYWDELIGAVTRSKFWHEKLDPLFGSKANNALIISNFRPEFFFVSDPRNMYFVGKVSLNAVRRRNSQCPRALVERVPNAIPVYSFNSELIPNFDQTFFVRRRRLARTAELCSRYWDELIVEVTRSKFSQKTGPIFGSKAISLIISNFRPEFFCLLSTQYVLRWKGLVERCPVTQFAMSSGTCGRSPQCKFQSTALIPN